MLEGSRDLVSTLATCGLIVGLVLLLLTEITYISSLQVIVSRVISPGISGF